MTPKPRSGKPMVSRPYVPESVKPQTGNQHPVVRKLGPNALANPALLEITDAADEIAAELGKTADQLTEEEAERAIELGKQRHANG